MNGSRSWAWQNKSQVLDRRDYNAGEEFTAVLARRERGSDVVELDKGIEPQTREMLKFEVALTSAEGRTTQRAIVYFPDAHKLRAMEVHPDYVSDVGDS